MTARRVGSEKACRIHEKIELLLQRYRAIDGIFELARHFKAAHDVLHIEAGENVSKKFRKPQNLLSCSGTFFPCRKADVRSKNSGTRSGYGQLGLLGVVLSTFPLLVETD